MDILTAIERFQGYIGGKSEHTVRSYTTAMTQFAAFKGENTDISTLTIDDVPEFAGYLNTKGLAASSVNHYVVAVMSFYRWLMRRKYTEITAGDYVMLQEEIREMRGNRGNRDIPELPKEQVVQATIATSHTVDSDDKRLHLMHLRNCAMLAILSYTGCRVAELAGLRRSNLIQSEKAAWVTGKGKKSRKVFLDDDAWQSTQAYLAERDKSGLICDSDDEPIMARHDKTSWGQGRILPMSTNALRESLNRLCREAGVKKYSPHKLRHRRLTEFLRETHNLELVRRLAGHESISTTQIYMHLADEELEAAVRGES